MAAYLQIYFIPSLVSVKSDLARWPCTPEPVIFDSGINLSGLASCALLTDTFPALKQLANQVNHYSNTFTSAIVFIATAGVVSLTGLCYRGRLISSAVGVPVFVPQMSSESQALYLIIFTPFGTMPALARISVELLTVIFLFIYNK